MAVAPVPRVLLTGGSGRLGTELLNLMPGIFAPTRQECDVLDARRLTEVVAAARPDVIVHAAAYTDVSRAEVDRARCWEVNVAGTRNVALAAREVGAKLLHVSTDYVFYGDTGGYREDDPPGPVRNYYALSKLAAEEVARTAPAHLVLRTSFRAREWPYPEAFEDLFTSQDYVDVIAPEIASLIRHAAEVSYDTLHIGTERKSVLELARRRAPDVRAASKSRAPVALPDDISLDTARWLALRSAWEVA
ncbi:MAG: NAD(P)-dependent oxidoreductase [Trueperaceae bacterium]|nr:NAD(P)-dependent oxidoreductase [Trueperaceae bacterium]